MHKNKEKIQLVWPLWGRVRWSLELKRKNKEKLQKNWMKENRKGYQRTAQQKTVKTESATVVRGRFRNTQTPLVSSSRKLRNETPETQDLNKIIYSADDSIPNCFKQAPCLCVQRFSSIRRFLIVRAYAVITQHLNGVQTTKLKSNNKKSVCVFHCLASVQQQR